MEPINYVGIYGDKVFCFDPRKFKMNPPRALRAMCGLQRLALPEEAQRFPEVIDLLWDYGYDLRVVSGFVLSDGTLIVAQLVHWGDKWVRWKSGNFLA